ncbi:MAG: hypothetical protein IJ679_00920, partial [Lachnospiraceae bacterium]|nr:hypothetical protein [Lachnospiraceae bacterium]
NWYENRAGYEGNGAGTSETEYVERRQESTLLEDSETADMVYRQGNQGLLSIENRVRKGTDQIEELQSQVRRNVSKIADKDIFIGENTRRIRRLERTISEQEATIQDLKKQIEASKEKEEAGQDFVSISPAFRRDWELEKMRYGLT